MSATSGLDIEKTLTAVILAGGKSERMGTDKALLLWNGETLLARTARTCIEAELPVTIVGRRRPEDWILPTSFVSDEIPYQGPLGGMIAALKTAESEYVLALGCDMPLLDSGVLRWLAESAAVLGSADDGLAVQADGHLQPLFSVYSRAVLALMERRFTEGRRSLKGFIEAGRFQRASAPSKITAKLVNINTTDEFTTVCHLGHL